MLRRIPSTPLVCLAFFLATILLSNAGAAGPDESMEILLKSSQTGVPAAPAAATKKPAVQKKAQYFNAMMNPYMVPPPPMAVAKVKPEMCGPLPYAAPCILNTTRQGQWDISAGAFFARSRGKIQWPRNWWWYYGGNWQNDVDLNDDLQLPSHTTLFQFQAKYQFRPNWGIRFTYLGNEMNGGGQVNDYFYFGNQYYSYGQFISSKWNHNYSRLGIVYDAIKTCNANVSVFADWVHAEDKITANCTQCGNWNSTFSKSTDGAIVGLEWQKCLKTMSNGGTFSCDNRAGVIFLDNVEGWDVQAAAKYSVPLNSGRSGYARGGYRLVEIKKSQDDFLFNNALEGGFMEFGFIF